MIRYKNRGLNSGVDSYEIGDTYLKVKFNNTNNIYTYSYNVAGKTHVEAMKTLAQNGSGLNSYIMNNVKKLYDK